MKTREQCITGIVSGGALAGIMGVFMMITSETRAVPVTDVYLRGGSYTAVMFMELILMFIGIVVMLSNISALGKLNNTRSNGPYANNNTQTRQNTNRHANNNINGQTTRGAKTPTYTYCYCGQCGRKLRLENAKGRVQAICPICGHKTLINC
jgi:DNA-directed RNA polymerase subunit RPC12/RpoP